MHEEDTANGYKLSILHKHGLTKEVGELLASGKESLI